jgi:uncharacterized SAM-binding protein YcdF (DUF218 family)
MDLFTIGKSAFGLLFLPPGLGITLVVVFGIGVLLLGKRSKKRTVIRCLFVLGMVISYALTTRTVGYQLALLVEGDDLRALPIETLLDIKKKDDTSGNPPTVIVVLGGGLKRDGREKPYQLNLNSRTALRVQHGAYLAKKLNLPILVSGGVGVGFEASEASIMARTLQDDYGLEVRWQEANSLTTAENARYASLTLQAAGIKKIILVTQAYHMRRSVLAFEAQGLEVVMAPCGFIGGVGADTHLAWLPAISGVEATYLATHEMVGLLFYWLKGDVARFSYRPESLRSP